MTEEWTPKGPWDDFPTYYWGRHWDAPMADDAVKMSEELVAALLPQQCTLCQEAMTVDDDLLFTPGMCAHLECHLRIGMGDVAHLEGRCICSGGQPRDTDHYDTYRESAKATLQWLLDNNRGRFHP